VNALKSPAEMTKGELVDEMEQVNYREPRPWSDEETERFLAVAREFISRVGQSDIEAEIARTKRITLRLIWGMVAAVIIFGLLIFGHIEVITR